MIVLENVAARRRPLALAHVSLAWGAGVHALVGGNADGGQLLLSLVAGTARPRSGRVSVLEGGPADAAVRRQLAFVSLQPALPDAMRVWEVLATGSAIRGESPKECSDRLRVLGIAALASRAVSSLSREETRAVAIAEAVTSSRVRVILVEEPLVALDPRAATRLPEVLRARASDGAAVLLATASIRDAWELAGDHTFLRDGSIVGQTTSSGAIAALAPQGIRMRIVSSDARALAAALAHEEGVDAVAWRGASVTVRGPSAVELARAAGRVIVACGIDVTEMCIAPPSLEDARAAVAGAAAAGRGP